MTVRELLNCLGWHRHRALFTPIADITVGRVCQYIVDRLAAAVAEKLSR